MAGLGEGFDAGVPDAVGTELTVGAWTFGCTGTGAGLAELCFGGCWIGGLHVGGGTIWVSLTT